jgi:hypothetical protein
MHIHCRLKFMLNRGVNNMELQTLADSSAKWCRGCTANIAIEYAKGNAIDGFVICIFRSLCGSTVHTRTNLK